MEKVTLIKVSTEELQNLIKIAVSEAFNKQPKTPIIENETYLTRQQVAKMLHVDLSTIHNWKKRGEIIAYQLGGRIYFKLSEIEQKMIQLK